MGNSRTRRRGGRNLMEKASSRRERAIIWFMREDGTGSMSVAWRREASRYVWARAWDAGVVFGITGGIASMRSCSRVSECQTITPDLILWSTGRGSFSRPENTIRSTAVLSDRDPAGEERGKTRRVGLQVLEDRLERLIREWVARTRWYPIRENRERKRAVAGPTMVECAAELQGG
ncbi:uncharacterized protein EV420DRAFT_1487435 [Desarmillaria tabescens]|uniref:Uncharacterized protein n=1 Tax=Armillaria tabescens TaxID=1929756 RepID=A0AA39MK49_ARMTA|nr:uncharacterized protein EV420DRAFT_1487435 [Desarmillaria tabescens]KAK0436818.1 hypothetical protein EV420DRAFT_1487435 [Desarmillaria tabescens]